MTYRTFEGKTAIYASNLRAAHGSNELRDRKRIHRLEMSNDCPNITSDLRASGLALFPIKMSAYISVNRTPAAIVLQRLGTIVIIEACKLSSRQRVATTACDVLPAPGIVG